jgi:hypothetical protein
MCTATITLPVQSQVNERSCVLLGSLMVAIHMISLLPGFVQVV